MEGGCRFLAGSFVIASSPHKEFHYDDVRLPVYYARYAASAGSIYG